MTTAPMSAQPEGGVRKSVPLTAQDLADLDLIRRSPEARSAVGITEDMSEAMQLHALVAASLQRAREAAEEAAYAALAADPEEQAFHAAMRRRGRRRAETEGAA